MTPSTGYSINQVIGCGGSLNGNTYTTAVITEACSISVTFTANKINGACGASHNTQLFLAPTSNLCSVGTMLSRIVNLSYFIK
ncbi:MAG: hypothetical protein HQL46_12425 [Gammaproteobacteria bacterium]|nr:hypothetical protein [Gammaproteobacteria bacterium]